MAENGKLRLLKILEIMRKTDEFHPINSTQIVKKLEQYGITAERKSIGRDIACLNDAGYDILKCENHNRGWYMVGQEFEDYELKLLVDSISTAKFLTIEDTRNIIHKIKQYATKEGERHINATLVLDAETKIEDKHFTRKFNDILNAITERKKIKFQYWDLAEGNKHVLRRGGHVYCVSPYYIVLSDNEYFLICNSSSHDNPIHFKIEKIINLEITEEDSRPMSEINILKEIGHGKTIGDYLRQSVFMWNGEQVNVTLKGKNEFRHNLRYKFGKNVSMHDSDDGFIAHIKVSASKGFFYWLASCGDNLTIVSPENVRQKYIEFLNGILGNYQ